VRVFPITTPKINKSEGAGGFLFINNMQKCMSISKTKRSLLPSWVISRTNQTRAPISCVKPARFESRTNLGKFLMREPAERRVTSERAGSAPVPWEKTRFITTFAGFPSPAIAPWPGRFAERSPQKASIWGFTGGSISRSSGGLAAGWTRRGRDRN